MTITINIVRGEKNKPPDKLADAELQFIGGELDGLKLIGFTVWARKDGGGKNVTFPARQFTVHGERRHFSLLRPVEDAQAEKRLKEVLLQAYLTYETGSAESATA